MNRRVSGIGIGCRRFIWNGVDVWVGIGIKMILFGNWNWSIIWDIIYGGKGECKVRIKLDKLSIFGSFWWSFMFFLSRYFWWVYFF